MNKKGWVSLHRELLNKPIWFKSTPEQKSVLVALVLMVNHEISEWEWKGEKFMVKAGETVTSLESIRKLAGKGISIQNVRTSIKRFKKLQFLTEKPTKMGRLISIVNWGSYQENNNTTQHRSQQRPNKDLTPNNNDNNVIKDILPKGNKLEQKIPTPFCPHEEIRKLYNRILPELPKCTNRNKTFDGYTRSRWKESKERQSMTWWKDFFKSVHESDFLMGRTEKSFRCSLDWIVKPTNFTKILNGNYANREKQENESRWNL